MPYPLEDAELEALIAQNITDDLQGQNSAARVREVLLYMVASNGSTPANPGDPSTPAPVTRIIKTTLELAQDLPTAAPPAVTENALYALTSDAWNGDTTATVYVRGLSATEFDVTGTVLANGSLQAVSVNVAEGTYAPLAYVAGTGITIDENHVIALDDNALPLHYPPADNRRYNPATGYVDIVPGWSTFDPVQVVPGTTYRSAGGEGPLPYSGYSQRNYGGNLGPWNNTGAGNGEDSVAPVGPAGADTMLNISVPTNEVPLVRIIPVPTVYDDTAVKQRLGAPQWVAGQQFAGQLVFDQGLTYRVKQAIANSQSAPATNPANYLLLGPGKLYTTTGQNTDGSLTQKAATDTFALKTDSLSPAQLETKLAADVYPYAFTKLAKETISPPNVGLALDDANSVRLVGGGSRNITSLVGTSTGNTATYETTALYGFRVGLADQAGTVVFSTAGATLDGQPSRTFQPGEWLIAGLDNTVTTLAYVTLLQGGAPRYTPSAAAHDAAVTVLGSANPLSQAAFNDAVLLRLGSGGSGGTTTQLAAPANLRQTASTSSSNTLAWDAVANATGYRLRQSGTIIYTGTSLSYTDAGLQASFAYSYTVQATGTGAYSDSAQSASLSATTAAATPTNFSSTPQATDYFDNANLYASGSDVSTGQPRNNEFARQKLTAQAVGPISFTAYTTELDSTTNVYQSDGVTWVAELANTQLNTSQVLTFTPNAAGTYVFQAGLTQAIDEGPVLQFQSINLITAPASMGVTRIAPSKASKLVIMWGDSTLAGKTLSNAGRYSVVQLTRGLSPDTDVAAIGYSGASAHKVCGTSPIRAAFNGQVQALGQGVSDVLLFVPMGINDKVIGAVTPTQWATELVTLFQELHALLPAVKIIWASPTVINDYGGNNSGYTIQQYRDALWAAPELSYVLKQDGRGMNFLKSELNDTYHANQAATARYAARADALRKLAVFPVVLPSNAPTVLYPRSAGVTLTGAFTFVDGTATSAAYTTAAGASFGFSFGMRFEIWGQFQNNYESLSISIDGAAAFLVDTYDSASSNSGAPRLVYTSPLYPSGSTHTVVVSKGTASYIAMYYVRAFTN